MDYGRLWTYLALPLAWFAWALAPAHRRPALLTALSLAFLALWVQWDVLAGLLALAVAVWALAPRLVSRPGRLWMGLGTCLVLFVGGKVAGSMVSQGRWLGTVGVSYFTLQAASYLVDVHLGQQAPEASLGDIVLYLAWFPKLVQGPFERCAAFLDRLRQGAERGPRAEELRRGLLLIGWGLFQKLVVADRAAPMVNDAFGHLDQVDGPRLLAVSWLFALQLFADFSGYTDLARGVSLLFGVGLSENFKAPFAATSVADFWRRWHLSFSDWIRDYLFEPLQMSWRDWGAWATPAALFVGMALVGLWHGVSAGYMAFYVLQPAAMVFALLTAKRRRRWWSHLGLDRSRIQRVFRTVFIFQYTCAGLMLFRAKDLPGLRGLFHAAIRGWRQGAVAEILQGSWLGGQAALEGWLLGAGLLALLGVHAYRRHDDFWAAPPALRYSAYAGLAVALLLFGRFFHTQGFLYAKF